MAEKENRGDKKVINNFDKKINMLTLSNSKPYERFIAFLFGNQ